jgi:hypothetical protein
MCLSTESKEVMEVALRGVLGIELCEISFLYFLTYVSAAGGLKNLVEATPYMAQEYTVQVNICILSSM